MFFNHYINKSLEDFIQENDKLMWQVAHDFKKRNSYLMSRSSVELEDMYSEAKIQFIKCYNSYNGKGEFSTYFYKSGLLSLKNYVNRNNGLIKINYSYLHKQAIKKLYLSHGYKNLTVKEISEICSVSEKVAQSVKEKYDFMHFQKTVSLTKKVNQENGELELIELIPNEKNNYEEKIVFDDLYENLNKILNSRQQKVLELKLKNYRNVEIADLMGVSRQAIHGISNQIKLKYKTFCS